MMIGRGPSFDILDLLPNALEFCLHFHDEVCNRRILALGADRVRLSPNFLKQEVEAPSDGTFRIEQFLELFEVAVQTHELFSHIAAICNDHEFGLEASWVY